MSTGKNKKSNKYFLSQSASKYLEYLGPQGPHKILSALEKKGVKIDEICKDILKKDKARCKICVSVSKNFNLDEQTIKKNFSIFGRIKEIIMPNNFGDEKCIIIRFGNLLDVVNSLEEPIKMIKNFKCVCSIFKEKDSLLLQNNLGEVDQQKMNKNDENEIQSTNIDDCRLFVRSLKYDVDSEQLRSVFQVFGEIVECVVIIERETGKSKGYGFVTFKNSSSAKEALKYPEKIINGRKSICNLASEGKKKNIFDQQNFQKPINNMLAQANLPSNSDPFLSQYFKQLLSVSGINDKASLPQLQQYFALQNQLAIQTQQLATVAAMQQSHQHQINNNTSINSKNMNNILPTPQNMNLGALMQNQQNVSTFNEYGLNSNYMPSHNKQSFLDNNFCSNANYTDDSKLNASNSDVQRKE